MPRSWLRRSWKASRIPPIREASLLLRFRNASSPGFRWKSETHKSPQYFPEYCVRMANSVLQENVLFGTDSRGNRLIGAHAKLTAGSARNRLRQSQSVRQKKWNGLGSRAKRQAAAAPPGTIRMGYAPLLLLGRCPDGSHFSFLPWITQIDPRHGLL